MSDTYTRVAETAEKLRQSEDAVATILYDMMTLVGARMAAGFNVDRESAIKMDKAALKRILGEYGDALLAHHNAVEAKKAESREGPQA